MPAVKASKIQIVSFGDRGLMEGFVVGVLQLDVLETFVLRHESIADDLDFGLVGYGLQVRV